MPVKRRNAKRRLSAEAELEAWADMFESGYDFFGDLNVFDIMTDAEGRAAAAEAWRRLGAAFLAEWKPTVTTAKPWATSRRRSRTWP